MRFQEKVWKIISEVPKGRVTTYKKIAERLGTKSYRAVGSACNKNPHAPIVPCHRVVNSDGRLGGYAYGTYKKTEILQKEGVKIVRGRIKDFKNILY